MALRSIKCMTTSANLNAIAPVAESLKTPLLYATNYEGGKCSRYLFSFSTVPNQELGQLLPYMNETFGNTYRHRPRAGRDCAAAGMRTG